MKPDQFIRRSMTAAAVALAFILLLPPAPSAPSAPADKAHRIIFDPGGVLFNFINQYSRFIENGTRVILDGPCLSACALVTMLPADQVCMTERAVLGFHSVRQVDPITHEETYDREWTRIYWRLMPRLVRARIAALGWDGESEHPDLVFLEGEMLEGVFERCWR